jgi:hypothetical protein
VNNLTATNLTHVATATQLLIAHEPTDHLATLDAEITEIDHALAERAVASAALYQRRAGLCAKRTELRQQTAADYLEQRYPRTNFYGIRRVGPFELWLTRWHARLTNWLARKDAPQLSPGDVQTPAHTTEGAAQ